MAVIQDEVFQAALESGRPISLFLKSGVPVRGKVIAHDPFTLLLEQEERNVMVYKHSITSVLGARKPKKNK